MLFLEILTGESRGKTLRWPDPSLTIGRTDSNDLVLSDYHLSGQHGRIQTDGDRVVYRREGGRFSPVPVRVGRQSISHVVVDDGLEPGDRIALRDPSETASRVFGGTLSTSGNGESAP